MKISIIIPIYNVEKYLKECIDSAINQTLEDIEIICVNDGSTDNSLDIVKKYSKKYKNIVIINKRNSGQSSARNTGLKIAKGEYIYFLDGDDFIDIKMCEECYSLGEKNNADIITFDTNIIYESEKFENSSISKYYNRCNEGRKKIFNSNTNLYNGKSFYNFSINNNIYVVSVCRYMYKKSFLINNNIFFKEGIIYEDNIFSTKSIILSNSIVYIDKNFFNRRIRENSTMTAKKGIYNVDSYFIVAKELHKFLIDIFDELNNETIKNLKSFIYINCKNAIDIYKSNNIDNKTILKNIEFYINEILRFEIK